MPSKVLHNRSGHVRFTFRVTLLTLLLGLLITTVGVVGVSGYLNARFIVRENISKILDQTSARVRNRIEAHLDTTARRNQVDRIVLTKELLPERGGKLSSEDFNWITNYFHEMLSIHDYLAFLSLGLEATGEYCHVSRMPKDWQPPASTGLTEEILETEGGHPVAIQQCVRGADGRMKKQEFVFTEKGDRVPFYEKEDAPDDPRQQDYYRQAVAAGSQIWTNVYIFNSPPEEGIPGVTCATPIKTPSGALLGVLTADVDVDEFSEFLRTLKFSQNGFAFIVEVSDRKDAEGENRHVIAYRDPSKFLRVSHRGEQKIYELVPHDQLSDPLLKQFIESIPETINFETINHAVPLNLTYDGELYLGCYRPMARHKMRWLICILLPEKEVMGRVDAHTRLTAVMGLISLLLAIILSIVLASRISRPLTRLAREAEEIGQFNLHPKPVENSIVLEVDRLAVAVEEMKTDLRSFQKYVPSQLVRQLVASGKEAQLGGEHQVLTVYFSDIANFTSISEKLRPDDLVLLLGEYLGAMSDQILASGGTVDKYIGDAVMAFWGAPQPNPGHALAACTAALSNQKKLEELRRKWKAENKPLFFARIGINTGELVVGNIGSESRMNYTVIGDHVNLASRLEGLNKYYGTSILINETTYENVRDTVVARPVDRVSVKGKTEGVLIYELLALKGQASPDQQRLVELSISAFQAYQSRRWAEASELLGEVMRVWPEDAPAKLMLGRCREFQASPPPGDWDGIWRMHEK